jgi:BirA family transcriptional regulator, biotin operon repressor / biotin---[acetyl-CoA-carboxylase] ligase
LNINLALPHRHFASIDSTNAEARRLLDLGVAMPLWITADEQTAGRGRLGRSWVSNPGNLYATLLMQSTAPLNRAPEIGFVAAVAVYDAVASFTRVPELKLKWPNDVLIGGAKFCGLLPEVLGQGPLTLALGCGINVATTPTNTPYPVTHLAEHASHVTVANMFSALSAHMQSWLVIWDNGNNFAAIRAAWLARCIGLNDHVTWQLNSGTQSGTFIDLAQNGALVAKSAEGIISHISSGEVRFAAVEKRRMEPA